MGIGVKVRLDMRQTYRRRAKVTDFPAPDDEFPGSARTWSAGHGMERRRKVTEASVVLCDRHRISLSNHNDDRSSC